MVNSQSNQAFSIFSNVTAVPEDPIFQLTMDFNKDTHPNKINLGAGAYRDDNAQPWVLSSVKGAKLNIANDPLDHHEYPAIAGLPKFRALAARLIFGAESPAILEGRVASNQTISGTGANHMAGLFIRHFYPSANIYLSSPTWGNHHALYQSVGFTKLQNYPYWDAAKKALDIEGMLDCMRSAPEGSVFLLHACAHNPTGVDPTKAQWSQIADVMQQKRHLPLFDSAYQGFASGNLDEDAHAVRLFVERGFELIVCQSFSKNLGIYAERCGAIHVVTHTSVAASCVSSQLADLTRSEISCTPSFGAKVAQEVMSNGTLYTLWTQQDLPTMAARIIEMRAVLHRHLIELKTPGNWDHIISQIGMFSYTGMTPAQCQCLVEEYHCYLVSNGRISISGLNSHNVLYFAQAMDKVVRTIR